jgi:predicted methyltransferase MtxX (methanogen marker protein 4)
LACFAKATLRVAKEIPRLEFLEVVSRRIDAAVKSLLNERGTLGYMHSRCSPDVLAARAVEFSTAARVGKLLAPVTSREAFPTI